MTPNPRDMDDTEPGLELGGVETEPATERRHSAAVLTTLRIAWKPSVSDYRLNTALAEEWEKDLPDWRSQGERSYRLAKPDMSYAVQLADGSARFRLEQMSSVERLASHVASLLSRLDELNRLPATVEAKVQFVDAVEGKTFSELMTYMRQRLLVEQLLQKMEAEAQDFAYLVDFEREGKWYQVNLGAVRAHEIPRRTGARLDEIPDLAIYCELTTKRKVAGPEFSTEDLIESLLQLGQDVLDEVKP